MRSAHQELLSRLSGIPIALALIASAMVFSFPESAMAQSGQTAETTVMINIRQGPSTQTSIVTTVPAGTRLEIIGTEGQFSNVRTPDGSEGYLRTTYLTNFQSAPQAMAAPAPAAAPAASPPAGDATELDTVMVTGSRIQRDEFASSSPISSFNRNDIDMAGTVSVDEFLMQIPAFTGFQLTSSTNNGGDGQKKVDLRGLGFNRTLVLINGRRQIGDINGDGAVDLNTIPDAMIERIEVLKDGASTIYGTDALAGVVNVVLKERFDGFQMGTHYGAGVEEDHAQNKGWSMMGGTSSGRGNFIGAVSYSEQKEMLQAERPWAFNALFPLLQPDGTFAAVASGSSNGRRMFVDLDGDPTTGRDGFEGQRIVDAGTGQARPFMASDVYNYAPVNALITPNEHWQISGLGSIELVRGIDGYLEGLYTRRTSHQRLAPDASFTVLNVNTPNNGTQLNDFVPADNPFNPYGVNPRNPDGISNQAVRINRRFVESGGRRFVQGADTFRVVTGIEGDLWDLGVGWDLSYTVAQNEVIQDTKNYGRFDRWAIAVDPVACAADPACTAAGGVLNPFDDYGSISQSQMTYLTAGSLKDRLYSQMNVIALDFTGSHFQLPGGAIGWALGAERRHEKGEFVPDEFSAEGLTTSGASDPQQGRFRVNEVYGELLLPVLDMLTFDLSTRHSDYDTSAGSKTTYKGGFDLEVISSLRLRGGYGTGFRAPNISELNQADSTTFPIVEPVCEFGDRRLAAGQMTQTAYDNCQAMGIDTTDAGEFGFAWQSAYTFRAPTVPLEPEESETIHFGVVFEPEMIRGASFGVDFWSITIENLIAVPDLNDLTATCINSVGLTSPACSVFVPSGGLPYDGPFPSDAEAEFGNLGELETAGLDFNALYEGTIQAGPLNRFHLLWGATYMDTYKRTFALSGERELVGTANGFAVFPEWRWNTEAGIGAGNWTAVWRMQFIGETEDALRPSSITDDAVAESVLYHDLAGSFTWRNLEILGGINNITDEDAPRFHSAFNANTEPGMYDVIGRRLFVGAKLTF